MPTHTRVRRVAVLADEQMVAGRYSRISDASEVASGVYFYRLQAIEFAQVKKMILLR